MDSDASDTRMAARLLALEFGSKRYNSLAVDFDSKRYDVGSGRNRDDAELHLPTNQEVALSPYGFVKLSLAERLVLDHPAVQRLRRVAQLGGASHVFPGAEHTRFPHSVGTVEAAERLMNALDANQNARARAPFPDAGWHLGHMLTSEERILVRLAALIHDIAHLPFGHTLEDELGLLTQHDTVARIQDALDFEDFAPMGRPLPQIGVAERALGCSSLAKLLDRLFAQVVKKCMRSTTTKSSVTRTILDLVAKDARIDKRKYKTEVFRVSLCREILTGPISADVMDYLPRDEIASGVNAGGWNPRLLQYLVPMSPPHDQRHPDLEDTRIVIDLGHHRRIKADAITAVKRLLDARFEMTQVVYRHPVKLASAAMLDRVLLHFFRRERPAQQILTEHLKRECFARFADEDEFLRVLWLLLSQQYRKPKEVASNAAARQLLTELAQGLYQGQVPTLVALLAEYLNTPLPHPLGSTVALGIDPGAQSVLEVLLAELTQGLSQKQARTLVALLAEYLKTPLPHPLSSLEIDPDDQSVLELLPLILLRRLHKVLYSFTASHGYELFSNAISTYSNAPGSLKRLRLAEQLEADFGLSPGDVVVYRSGPRPAMQRQDIWLAIDGTAAGLMNLEDQSYPANTPAGRMGREVAEYFKAQQEQFNLLGRFEILMSNAALAQLDALGLGSLFLDVVRMAVEPWNPDKAASHRAIAKEVAEKLGRSLTGIGALRPAARGGAARDSALDYPNGMPPVWFGES